MLTATYSLIAIAAEQMHVRSHLQSLQHRLQDALKGVHHPDCGFLDAVWSKLVQFDEYCRNRKMEVYLIPALHSTDRDADALISELESLSAAGAELLRSVGERIAAGCTAERAYTDELCMAMERYCSELAVRLDKEEQALLPLARRCLSTEAWFAVAAKLLVDHAGACQHGEQPRVPADLAAMPAQ